MIRVFTYISNVLYLAKGCAINFPTAHPSQAPKQGFYLLHSIRSLPKMEDSTSPQAINENLEVVGDCVTSIANGE